MNQVTFALVNYGSLALSDQQRALCSSAPPHLYNDAVVKIGAFFDGSEEGMGGGGGGYTINITSCICSSSGGEEEEDLVFVIMKKEEDFFGRTLFCPPLKIYKRTLARDRHQKPAGETRSTRYTR